METDELQANFNRNYGTSGEHATSACVLKDESEVAHCTELNEERGKRFKSLAIVCFSGFTFNFAFSVVLTSAYPYLVQMEDGNEEGLHTFLGWVVAAQPLAQFVFSPLMGYLGNRFGTIRYLSMFTMALLAVGFVFYACIHAFPPPRKYYIVAARLIVGAAAGTTTLCYSYVAGATKVKERTMAFGLLSFTLSSAFVLGPAVQAAFVPLTDGIDMGGNLRFNKFTASSWMAAAFSLINVVLFLPGVFDDFIYVARREARTDNSTKNQSASTKVLQPDKGAAIVCIVINALVQFNFIFLETLATPVTMGMLGWTDDQAMLYVGIAFAAGGLYNGIISGVMGSLAHRMNERVLMMTGIALLILGPVVFFPYSGPTPPRKFNVTSLTSETQSIHRQLNGTSPANGTTGCPMTQKWCDYTPAVRPEQMIAGFTLIATGYPLGMAFSTSIFSKILGPIPQGTWMGVLAAGGCLVRFLCPICVARIYDASGTRATFGFMASLMACGLLLIVLFYKRLIPYQQSAHQETTSSN